MDKKKIIGYVLTGIALTTLILFAEGQFFIAGIVGLLIVSLLLAVSRIYQGREAIKSVFDYAGTMGKHHKEIAKHNKNVKKQNKQIRKNKKQ